MKAWKKWVKNILSLTFACALAVSTTACGSKDSSSESVGNSSSSESSSEDLTPIEVEYTLVVTDQDDNPVVGAKLIIMQYNMVMGIGTTDEKGEIAGTLEVGEGDDKTVVSTLLEGYYEVFSESLPSGVRINEGERIYIFRADTTIEIAAEITYPDGTETNPYPFTPDKFGSMSVTLPASAEHYYSISRPWGRTFIVEGNDVELRYLDETGALVTLTPTAGKIEVALGSAEDKDGYEVVRILLVNTKAEDNELTLALPVAPGSNDDVAFAVELNQETTAEVVGSAIVYYAWTATETGTLSISSTNTNAHLYLYNKVTHQATGDGVTTLAVEKGQDIQIQVGLTTATAGETVDVPFILTLQV